MRISTVGLAASLSLAMQAGVGAAHADIFNVTYEAPGAVNTTLPVLGGGVETFDSLSTGTQNVSTSFGAITGEYTGVQINSADPYGGAGGTGNYAVAFLNTPYTLQLSTGVNYFGAWFSAIDPSTTITFYDGAQEVGSETGTEMMASLSANSAYYGNPSGNYFHGDDPSEIYAFVNFVDTSGKFNKIVFSETTGCCGFESDNHTIGDLPEPATWAMMLLGFGGVGAALRRKTAAPRAV